MSNVIPFIRDKKTRDKVKADREQGNDYLRESLNRINEHMAELRKMAATVEGVDAPTLNQEELDKEYKRKQDEMHRRRIQNNKDVTFNYRLHRKPDNKK